MLQPRIPAALCTIHNFIWEFDSSEGKLPADNFSLRYGDTNGNAEASGGNDRLYSRRDRIAEDMQRGFKKKEGCLMRQRRVQQRNYLTLMNGIMRIISFRFNFCSLILSIVVDS